MIKLELFYNSEVDNETEKLAQKLKEKFADKVDIFLRDTTKDQIPENYGIINPPAAVIDGRQKIKIEGHEEFEKLIMKAIF